MIDRLRAPSRAPWRDAVRLASFSTALPVLGDSLPGALTGTGDLDGALPAVAFAWPLLTLFAMLVLPSPDPALGPPALPRRRRQAIRLGATIGLLWFVVAWLLPSHGPLDHIFAAHLAGALGFGMVTTLLWWLFPPRERLRPLPAHPTRWRRLEHWLNADDVAAGEATGRD